MAEWNPNQETEDAHFERLLREFGFEDEDEGKPTGSCENCDGNLYFDDEYDGLCSQCAWWATQE